MPAAEIWESSQGLQSQAETVSPGSSKEASPAAATPRKAFGGILSSVVKEAAETATKRPPVFRYEDFKTVSCSLLLICICNHCAVATAGDLLGRLAQHVLITPASAG